MNNYPCGNHPIRPGEPYWSLALPPGADPFNAKMWVHADECDECYVDRHGRPIDELAEVSP